MTDKIQNKIHPCIDCLVLAACKDKPLLGLIRKCWLLNRYLYKVGSLSERVTETRKILNTDYQSPFQD